MIKKYKFPLNKIAIEKNNLIVEKKNLKIFLKNNDKIDCALYRRRIMENKDYFIISNKKFTSRLIVGTGKYKNFKECSDAVKASGAEIVTVAVRRVNITDKKPLLMDFLNPKKITYLPNTAGCFNSNDALRTLRLARDIGGWKLVKLEILGDKKTLLPDMIETLKSTEVLAKEGFQVMVYCNDDPLMAKRLENAGAVAIMPLAAPIGSGLEFKIK